MAAIVAISRVRSTCATSALQELLGRHHYQDGSYLYVVDRDGKLIYHVDPSRLGEDVSHNPVVAAVKQGESGARRLLNTRTSTCWRATRW